MFDKSKKASGIHMFNKEANKYIAPKDGNTHVLMITSFSKFGNQNFSVDGKFTGQINPILDGLQQNGYEIVDVKVSAIGNQGFSKGSTQFQTVILYK